MTTPTPEQIARSLRDAGFGEYMVWSDGQTHTVVAGVRASCVLEGSSLSLRDGHGTRIASVETRDPFVDAGGMLAAAGLGPFRAWGYLGFGLAAFRHAYRKRAARDLHLIVPEVTCRAAGDELTFEGSDDAVRRARAAIATPSPARAPAAPVAAALEAVLEGRAPYEEAVREVLEAIRAREVGKVILARQVRLEGTLDALATFAASAGTQAARRFAFELDGIRGAGACPEMLLLADGEGRVVTNPLAGTQPRGATEEEDARLRANLLFDAKEVSEHAMSINLAYQELASVCTADTLRVVDFMEVKRYAFTQHLSSRAAGTLAPSRTSWDALRAVFPGVTCSGIAKDRALALIDRLESTPRGVYGGAAGWVDHTGAMDWGITLRSAFDYGTGVTLNAGAGIVLDSDPAYEFDESAHKMRTIAARLVLAP